MAETAHLDAGRQQWLDAAVDSYQAPLTHFAQGILGDAEAARDVVQETFVRLCRAAPEEINGHLGQWLFTVCRNQAYSAARKEDRMLTLTEVTQAALAAPDREPAESLERRETAGSLQQCLQRLPQNQQTVIRLKFQHRLRYREIAETTGLSLSNVGFLIHQAIKTLRREMAP